LPAPADGHVLPGGDQPRKQEGDVEATESNVSLKSLAHNPGRPISHVADKKWRKDESRDYYDRQASQHDNQQADLEPTDSRHAAPPGAGLSLAERWTVDGVQDKPVVLSRCYCAGA
jgi:hypothetical protein